MKIDKNIIKSRETYIYGLFFIFYFVNFIIFFKAELFAPPDFYGYYFNGVNLLKGNLNIFRIPPLFPLSIILMGKVFSIFPFVKDSYIFGTKFLVFLFNLGFLFIFSKLLKEFVGDAFIFVLIFTSLSPFFLKFLSLPLTDIIFLFFLFLSFYFINRKDVKNSFWSVVGGFLTRFEGVWLFFSWIISLIKFNRENLKLRKIIFWFFLSFLFAVNFIYYTFKFFSRFFYKIALILKEKDFLFFFKNPGFLIKQINRSLLFFLKDSPAAIFMFFWIGLAVSFVCGSILIYKKNRKFFYSFYTFFLFFVIIKGYIYKVGLNADHTRRLLPFLYFLIFVFSVGIMEVGKKLFKTRYQLFVRIVLILFFGYVIFLNFVINKAFLFSLVFLFLVSLLSMENLRKGGLINFSPLFLFFFFLSSVFGNNYRGVVRFVKSTPKISYIVAAKWFNHRWKGGVVATFGQNDGNILRYYLKKKIPIVYPPKGEIKTCDMSEEEYWQELLSGLYELNVKYVITNFYLPFEPSSCRIYVKTMLNKMVDNKDFRYFEVKKYLFYEKRHVGTILKVKTTKLKYSFQHPVKTPNPGVSNKYPLQ